MAKYQLAEKALEDLRGIWRYTLKTWSEEQAEKYVRNLMDAFEVIAKKPDSMGKSYEHVRAGYRGLHSGKHIIFFKVSQEGKVRIVRILHERMDFPRHL